MKKTKSIIQTEESIKKKQCYLCVMLEDDTGVKYGLQEHHIFGGANRYLSEGYGLKVMLCARHHGHGGDDDVHNEGRNNYMKYLHSIGQRKWVEWFMSQDKNASEEDAKKHFREIFGKNYL